jgi:cobalt-zinc-cadmium efflux system outer membrane protein
MQLTRSNLVSCTLAASPDLRVEREAAGALEGRRRSAGTLLPSNPVLALTGARRTTPGTDRGAAFNWSATLSQELELAGQRGSRLRAVEAEQQAQQLRLVALQRDAVSQAWSLFFEVSAARAQQELAERMLEAAQRVALVARAKAEQGLVASVDADVAQAASLRVLQQKLMAEQAEAVARAQLALVVGNDPGRPVEVAGELTPLSGLPDPAAASALSGRPEVQAWGAERSALSARAQTLRRARVPNPTFSAFAEQDGYGERVYGLGLSLPLPLPSPVGQSRAGEIAELEALRRQADAEQSRALARAGLELARARASYAAHSSAVRAFDRSTLERAESSLSELSTQIQAGRLSVRDALPAQQALIDLLRTHLEELEALCLASVELARALDLPLERGLP